jgi:hypothetical protein
MRVTTGNEVGSASLESRDRSGGEAGGLCSKEPSAEGGEEDGGEPEGGEAECGPGKDGRESAEGAEEAEEVPGGAGKKDRPDGPVEGAEAEEDACHRTPSCSVETAAEEDEEVEAEVVCRSGLLRSFSVLVSL